MSITASYEPDYRVIDKALLPVNELIMALGDIQGEIKNEFCEMSIESIKIEMPFEMDIRNDTDDNIVLSSSPPTQKIETTFMPVFHKIKLNIEIIQKHVSDE